MRVDRERLRQLDEEIADVAGGTGFYPACPAADTYLRDVLAHPDGGGLYDSLECPNGSKVVLLREYPVGDVSGSVWLRMMPVGPRAQEVPQLVLVGTLDEIQGWYAELLGQLAEDGWQPAGAVSVEAEVVEADSVADAEVVVYAQAQEGPIS